MSSAGYFGSAQAEESYITQRAKQLGLDPEAVLAIAAHEGVTLPSQVGDSGSSFGPWQLHHGGALPETVWSQGPAYAEQWANSQAGIDYALQSMAKIAAGLKGPTAIQRIVYGFEKPVDPASETAAATQTYQQGGGPSAAGFGTISNLPGAHGTGPSLRDIPVVGGDLKGAYNSITSLGGLISFVTSWRFAEVVGGFALLLVGLILLGRQFGVSAPGAGIASRVPGA